MTEKAKRKRKTPAKKPRMADGLIRGLREALAYSRGELKLREHVVEVPAPASKRIAVKSRGPSKRRKH